jgi:hypothetical protein
MYYEFDKIINISLGSIKLIDRTPCLNLESYRLNPVIDYDPELDERKRY